ncbi:flagellar protein [Bacillus sp. DNRA2]|uniref:flagellar protein n=1 Tax=Bacillus sp. DNRA2 TaxID=2723053 RepID=UPI00145E1324|nr:flagellar protein [Bacillus sp. DNRA2]NMD69117.1 flagellar protein [Bacillus sp. DNRA2]
MVSSLGNCPKCGKLYLKVRKICDACFEKQEEDFRKVSSYLWDHPGCSMKELSEGTDVSTSQIRQFIMENRILIGQFSNLSYPCDSCGKPIKHGRTCPSCLKNVRELAQTIEFEKQKEKEEKDRPSSYKIYRD